MCSFYKHTHRFVVIQPHHSWLELPFSCRVKSKVLTSRLYTIWTQTPRGLFLNCTHLAHSSYVSLASVQLHHPQRLSIFKFSLPSLQLVPRLASCLHSVSAQMPSLGTHPWPPHFRSLCYSFFQRLPMTLWYVYLLAYVFSSSSPPWVSSKKQELLFFTVYSRYPQYHLEGHKCWKRIYWLNEYVNKWLVPEASVTCPISQTTTRGFRLMTWNWWELCEKNWGGIMD